MVPETRDQDAVLEFSFVYPNPRGGGFIFRKVATVSVSDPGSDDDLTLKKARFHIGDYIDISIILPS